MYESKCWFLGLNYRFTGGGYQLYRCPMFLPPTPQSSSVGCSIDLSEKSGKFQRAQASVSLVGILNFHHNLIAVPIITLRTNQHSMSSALGFFLHPLDSDSELMKAEWGSCGRIN